MYDEIFFGVSVMAVKGKNHSGTKVIAKGLITPEYDEHGHQTSIGYVAADTVKTPGVLPGVIARQEYLVLGLIKPVDKKEVSAAKAAVKARSARFGTELPELLPTREAA